MAKSIKLANSEQKFHWSNQSRNEKESKELQLLKSNKITPQSSPTKYVQVCQNKLDDQTNTQLELIDKILKRLDDINNEIYPNEYKFNGYFYQSPIYKNVVCWKKTNEKKVITVAIDPDKHSNKKQIQDDQTKLEENKFKNSFHSIKSNDSNKEGFRPILSKDLSSSIVNKTSVQTSSNERFFKPIQNSNTLSNVENSNEILKEPKTNQSVLKSDLDEYDYSKSPEEILKKKSEFDYKEFVKNYSGPKSTIDNQSEKENNSVYNDSLARHYEDESKILQNTLQNEINNEKKSDEKEENDQRIILKIFFEKFNKDANTKIPFVFECNPTNTSQSSQNINNILLKFYFDLEQYLKTNDNRIIELNLDAQQFEQPQSALSNHSNQIFQSSSFNHYPSLISTATYRKTNSEILPNRIGFNNNMSRSSYSTDTIVSREIFFDNLRKMSEKHRSQNLNEPPSIYKLRRAYSSLLKTNEDTKNDNNQSFEVVSSIIYDQNPDYYMNQNYSQEPTNFENEDGNLRLIAFFNEMDKIYYEEEQKLNKINQSQTPVNKVMIQETNLINQNNLTNSSNNTNLESDSNEKMNISSDIEDLKVKSLILNQLQSSNSTNESNLNDKTNISMTESNNHNTKSPTTFQPILVISKSPNQIKTIAENTNSEIEKKINLEENSSENKTKQVLILSNASFEAPVANNVLEKRELEQKNSSAENLKIFGLESQIVVHDRQQQPIQKQIQQNQKTSTDTENDDPNNKVPPARKKKKPSQSSKVILGGVIVTSTSHAPSAITPSTSKPSSVTVSNSAQPSSEIVSNSTSLKEPNKLKTENIDKVENYVAKFEHKDLRDNSINKESEDFEKSLDKTDSETSIQKLQITSLIVSNNVKIEQKNLKEADTDEELRSFSNQADSFLRKLKAKKQPNDDNQSKKSLPFFFEEMEIDEKELNKEKKSEEKKNVRKFSDLADSILRKAKSRENVTEANQIESSRTDSELEHKSSLSEKIAGYEEYSRSSGYIQDESLKTKSNKTGSRSTLQEASEIHTITNDELNESDYDINKFNAIILPNKSKSSNKDNTPTKAKKYVSSKNNINTSRRKTERIIADTKDLSSDSSDNKPIKKTSRSNSFILNKILLTDMNRPKLDDRIYYKETERSNVNLTLKSSDKALKEADDYLKLIQEERKKIESDLSRNTSFSNKEVIEQRSNKKGFDEKMFQVKSEQPQLSRNQFSSKQTRPNEESLKESSINNSNSDSYSDSNLNKSFKRKSSLFEKIFSKNKK